MSGGQKQRVAAARSLISNPDIIVEKRQLEDFIAYMNSDNNYQMFGPTIEEHGKLNRGWKQKSIKYDIHDNYPIINRLYKNLIISSLHEYTELNKLFRNFPKT